MVSFFIADQNGKCGQESKTAVTDNIYTASDIEPVCDKYYTFYNKLIMPIVDCLLLFAEN